MEPTWKNSILKNVGTVCSRDCYDTCSLKAIIDKSQNKIISLKPDETNPITQDFLCPRGAKDLARIQINRIDHPYLKNSKHFEIISWEKSFKIIEKKIQQTKSKYNPKSILSLYFAGNQGLLSSIYPQRLWNALGATQTDCSLCTASGHAALNLHYGESYGIQPLELLKQKLIVFWGFNAAVCSPHIWALAKRARKENSAKIIVIDPIKTLTTKQADLWIQIFPGHDKLLAYCIINNLINKNKIDLNFIQKWTIGFEALKTETKHWTLEKTSEYTGICKKSIEQIINCYSTIKPSVSMIGIGLQKSKTGGDTVRAISFIPTILGYHRSFFYSNSNAYYFDNSYITGASLTKKKIKIVNQVSLAKKINAGKFKFIYINCMNPARTLPDSNTFIQGITRNDIFTVVHDTHWTATARLADLVLPAPTFLEKDDLVLPWAHNFIRYSKKVIEPLTNSRDEIYVMQKIAHALNLKEQWLYRNPCHEIKNALKNSLSNGKFEDLVTGKILKLKLKPKNHYSTTSGKINFNTIKPDIKLKSKNNNCKKFILLSSSTSKYTSTQFQDIYGKIPAIVKINPSDALRLNITDNEKIILSNKYGSVKLQAKISDEIINGTLWTPRQCEDLDGIPVNSITSSTPQKIGKGSSFNSTSVTVLKLI